LTTRAAVALLTAVAHDDAEGVEVVLDGSDTHQVAVRVARWLVGEVVHNRGREALMRDLGTLGGYFARDDVCPCDVADPKKGA